MGLLLLLCVGGTGPGQDFSPDVRRDATVAAVEQVMPCVVNIATETIIRVRDPFEEFFRQFWDPYHRGQPPSSRNQYSLGSGVVIDEAGYLLTNDHVVRRADRIGVRFSTRTNDYEAVVIARDPKNDVALLKLKARDGEKFKAIKFAPDDDLLLGETVLAMGNPFGLGGTVTRGILSSKSRLAPKEGEPLEIRNLLQTDAPINPGNSGGPLVNLRGELIGINVAVLSQAQGIGFALPIKRVIEALSEIFPNEFIKSFWFGARVKVGSLPLVITSVQPQSPAERAGLRTGDEILRVNEEAPSSFIGFADLMAAKASPAGEVLLKILRGTTSQDVPVRMVEEKTVFNADLIRQRLGLSLEELSSRTAQRMGVSPSDGFLIAGVETNSPAAAAKLQSGILVTAIDGETPPDLTAVAKLLYAKKRDERVQLDYAVRQRMSGGLSVLQQGTVELSLR